MESVTIKNYRCFREEQTARLAPLTFLVGENSTGKTSFLALIRALWDTAYRGVAPDFRQPPYDLGSFRDIVHQRGGRTRLPDSFEAGFEHRESQADGKSVQFRTTFKERHGVPFPIARSLNGNDAWIQTSIADNGDAVVQFGTSEKKWERQLTHPFPLTMDDNRLINFFNLITFSWFSDKDNNDVEEISLPADEWQPVFALLRTVTHPVNSYAGAPVRSYPKRTYDPIRPSRDPEGEYIPTHLATVSRQDSSKWQYLKGNLEEFGQQSGLFDEIQINSLGNTAGSPFQVHIRKYSNKSGGRKRKGPTRNLIDVGYGVSQALPLITELVDPEARPLFLLQQPEVHLHPSAQAALGTLFCSIAAPERQLIVETHSDYILDRVVTDVRDQKTELKPEDVSILYFEMNDLDVTIHSLGLDKQGNILGAPDGYRQFFTNELRRVLGI